MILAQAPLRAGLPGSVLALLVYSVALEALNERDAAGRVLVGNMSAAVGRWLARKTETVQDAEFAALAVRLGVASAAQATADFSALLPGAPAYLQFDPSEAWIRSMQSGTDAARVAEIKRLRANYPEAEVLQAINALIRVRVNTDTPVKPDWAAVIYREPERVLPLFVAAVAREPAPVWDLSQPAAQVNYNAAMMGAQGAHLPAPEKIRYLVKVTAANYNALNVRGLLPVFWRNLLGDTVYWPPTPSPGAQGIGAARLEAATGVGPAVPDLLKQREAVAALLRVLLSWASGYEQRAAEYQAQLETTRAAEQAAAEKALQAAAALLRQASAESAKAAMGSAPRRRSGVLVTRAKGQVLGVERGEFERTGPGRSVVVDRYGVADLGTWRATV